MFDSYVWLGRWRVKGSGRGKGKGCGEGCVVGNGDKILYPI